MELCISDDFEFNELKINEEVDLKISVQMVTHSLPNKTQEYMGTLLQKYLEECGMKSYFNKLNYCLSEILVNAVKANLKRIYFREYNLDINNPIDYEKGMKNFRSDMLSKRDYYMEKQRTSDLYITYSLKLENCYKSINKFYKSVISV